VNFFLVNFTVVEEINPSVIGDIELQEQFEFRLVRVREEAIPVHLYNIEAKFGKNTNDEVRLLWALTVLKPERQDGLREVIIQNRGTLMADNCDIGCTTLVKHHIKTNGSQNYTKPWRQPIHLEGKIKETIKNLYDKEIQLHMEYPNGLCMEER